MVFFLVICYKELIVLPPRLCASAVKRAFPVKKEKELRIFGYHSGFGN
jgi:hypothetical protein